MMKEEWRPVPGWEHRYEVSDMGRIRSKDMRVPATGGSTQLRRGRLLVPIPKQGRYLAVTFAEGERREQHTVHTVVLRAFKGECPAGLVACHADDDKANNVLSNLRWDTYSANCADREKNGNGSKGEKHPSARLTAEQVHEIRRRTGEDRQILAAEFGVSAGHIYSVQTRKTWKHI